MRERAAQLLSLFHQMTPAARRVVWLCAGMWVFLFCATVWAAQDQSPVAPSWTGTLLTVQNIVTLSCLIFTLGTVYQQFKAQGERITQLEKEVKELTDEHLPREYVRTVVFEEYRRAVELRRRRAD